MPAKKSDPRFKAFAESYGDRAVELDALPGRGTREDHC